MRVYSEGDVNTLYRKALFDCMNNDLLSDSRVGDVFDLGPACFELDANKFNLPCIKGRGLNPFFAIAEVAWVLGGLNELDTLQYYLKSYDDFSDDGITLNGAYGNRIRNQFGFDQLDAVVAQLIKSPNSRRAVISIYSPEDLVNHTSKDIPCNISVLFKIRNNALDMTVFNRSNDVFWGIPYNFLVFQSLLYYVASKIDFKMGIQRHISDSLHLYKKDLPSVKSILDYNIGDKLEEFDPGFNVSIFNSILSNIDSINLRDYENIEDKDIGNLFCAYRTFKDEGSVNLISSDGYVGVFDLLVKDWFQVNHSSKLI